MTTPHRISQVAEGLTEAQRRAILRCKVKPAANAWVRDTLGLAGTFECYIGDGVVSEADFAEIGHLFQPVGAIDPRGAATLFGNVTSPGLAVKAHLEAGHGS